MKSSSRALLAALLAVVAALAALTLSAGAQTPGGELDPDESGSTETAQGRIIARVQDRTGEDGVDDYRIEFGFFPEWALEEAESWPEAIASRSGWLPSSRFLTKSRIDARAAADNRGWLRSSLITVPAQSAQSPGGGSAEITGRVIARYNPDSEGRLRVEFGFVPAWAFTDTSSTAEAVERLGADGLPRARYLSVATIDARRDVWLRSSVVDVPLRAPVVVIEQPQAPVIDSVSCTPSSSTVDESVTCTATLSGGALGSYNWSGGGDNGSSERYTTSFSEAGEHTVSLTVTNAGGSDSESTTVNVEEPAEEPTLQAPVIDGITCSPSSPTAGESVTCTATLSGGAPDSWAWRGGGASSDSDRGSGESYTTSFDIQGLFMVMLTVRNDAGSDIDSITIRVEEPTEESAEQAPVIESIDCDRVSTWDIQTNCTATLSGGAPESWSWSGGDYESDGKSYSPIFDTAGRHTISLTVTNSSGSDSASFTFTITAPPPYINYINCSPTSPVVDESVTCTADLGLRGGDPESWSWSGGASSGSDERYTTSFDTAGEYTVSLTATNSIGSDTYSVVLSVEQPLQSPVIDGVICTPSSPEVDEDVTCTATLSGGAPESWAWRTVNGAGSGVNYSTSFSKAGDYAVSLTVTNAAGSDTESTTVNVEEPAEEPTLQAPAIDSISCSPSSLTVGEETICTAELSGGTPESWIWDVDNGSGGSGSGGRNTISFSRAGEQTVSLAVINDAGRDRESITVSVVEPLQRPVIDSIRCSPSSPTVGESVTCTATLSGGAPDYRAWSGGDYESISDSYSPIFDTAGRHTISLTVTNSSGSDTDSITFTVTAPTAPRPVINDIRCSPPSPTVSQSVTCTANLSGGTPDSYAWSDSASGSGNRTTYGTAYFETAGEYTVSLTVTNSAGSDSDSVTFTVVEPSLAPVINFIRCTPSSPEVRYDDVTCTAALSGGAPTSWAWSGGEGYSATLTRETRIYETNFETAGERTVSLTVTNGAGSDSESITLTVYLYP